MFSGWVLCIKPHRRMNFIRDKYAKKWLILPPIDQPFSPSGIRVRYAVAARPCVPFTEHGIKSKSGWGFGEGQRPSPSPSPFHVDSMIVRKVYQLPPAHNGEWPRQTRPHLAIRSG